MDKNSKDFKVMKSLKTLAYLAIAKQLRLQLEIKKKVDACLKSAAYKNNYSSISKQIAELVKNLHPIVPIFFGKNVINFIGENLFGWIFSSEKKNEIVLQMIIGNIQSIFFSTTDRVRGDCVSETINFINEILYECCYEKNVQDYREKPTLALKNKFEINSREYKFYAIAFCKCYVQVVGYDFHQEIFILYCDFDAPIIHYWSQLTTEQQIRAMNILLCKNYPEISIFEDWIDLWINELITSRAQITTFIFLWNQFYDFYRRKLILFICWSVFIIRWKINDTYFNQICNNWKSIFTVPWEVTSSTTEEDEYLKIFNNLWKSADNLNGNEKTVAEFLWKYHTIYKDVDSTSFVIKKLEKIKKIEIMAPLNQIISVYNANEKYHRFQEFIQTEVLNFHRPDEAQIEMPEEVGERDGEESTLKKLSMFIIILIAIIYAAIFVLLIS